MSFSHLYRISFYIMMIFATLVLSVDLPEARFAMLFPIVVTLGALAAFLTVDREKSPGLSRRFADALALGSIGMAMLEYRLNTEMGIVALGHWLVYLQIILFFRPKTVSGDWLLFGLGLVQVLVGTVVSQSHATGMMLLGWAVLTPWVLGLFSLEREAIRSQVSAPEDSAPRELLPPGVEPYPGLLNPSFLISALRITLTTLALGGVVFLAMPRHANMTRARGTDGPAQHMTGFDDEVALGQLGEILESDNIVMTIEMFDESGQKLAPTDEPLWRGVTMAHYVQGRWTRQDRRPSTIPTIQPNLVNDPLSKRPRGIIRQLIKLESNDSNVLFGLRPIKDATGSRRGADPQINTVDGTLISGERRATTIDYEVRSYRDAELPQPGEHPPGDIRGREMLRVPDEIRGKLTEIANAVIERTVPLEDRDDRRARAQALEAYLRDSGEFGYTLKLDVVDPSIDPVLDFLINRKQGHCEYFASALTLLLRAAGVPARLVNGFKGGDWNAIAQVLSVRQKHAHSWVEAYMGEFPGADHLPIWLTLDPTPGQARDASVAQVGGFRRNFRQFSDLIRYIWVFYIVGFNAERQNAVIYEPIRKLAAEARKGFGLMGQSIRTLFQSARRLVHFENAQSLFSFRGFLVGAIGFGLLYGLVTGMLILVRRIHAHLFGDGKEQGPMSAGAIHYRRLVALLAQLDLAREPSETQAEFARRATLILNEPGTNRQAVADVPRVVVDAFYRSRFGDVELSPAAHESLDARLDALEASLRTAGA